MLRCEAADVMAIRVGGLTRMDATNSPKFIQIVAKKGPIDHSWYFLQFVVCFDIYFGSFDLPKN